MLSFHALAPDPDNPDTVTGGDQLHPVTSGENGLNGLNNISSHEYLHNDYNILAR